MDNSSDAVHGGGVDCTVSGNGSGFVGVAGGASCVVVSAIGCWFHSLWH